MKEGDNMKGGRLFVVDKNTHTYCVNNNLVMVSLPNKPPSTLYHKTLIDLMADMMQLSIGDYVFFWRNKFANSPNSVLGVYRVASEPYFDTTPLKGLKGENTKVSKYPFRVKIEEAYSFKSHLTEYKLLNDPFLKMRLWNIVGKKVGNKPRANVPLTPIEVELLIQKFVQENKSYSFTKPKMSSRVSNILSVNLKQKMLSPRYKLMKWEKINFKLIPFVSNNGKNLTCEKVLEAYFNENIRTKKLSNVFDNLDDIVWYGNYLPYSTDSAEMDYVVFHSDDGHNITRISVVEFMINNLDEDHIKRLIKYGEWVSENLLPNCPLAVDLISVSKKIGLTKTKLRIEKMIKKNMRRTDITTFKHKFFEIKGNIIDFGDQ